MTEHWVFGYGSLIWKADFPFLDRRQATISGWERRFWQGSHDHRGTPEAPGRVLTLTPVPGAVCSGVVYKVTEDVFEHLDHREKNGYRRVTLDVDIDGGDRVLGTVYFADHDNPAFLGTAPLAEIAAQIERSNGPSGSNAEYLLEIASALRVLRTQDAHVFRLESLLKGRGC
ncbi:gamma-glutamylcyclotransferase [Halieaceae bacterium IMCC14734]|uniref:glutathione-specific gamma-glutamylcyclotransferase n=1 Tax=Candidatus Litorirhabdus singularis TaxID=2518993 RepID=A0ABT3TG12_9GAMM|nr:gamma-glutamylcyclotransferase [Candidatus Litorirhabdus singularis]MCX2981251.1 gamma-glutamylcyclotransferase [Candidatus Litorirhabdus singularis]